ncbi:fimbrial biogenesis chaperone [Piscinibacter sp.]|uniref:fimbrial biogenesis chaperone n=1 Tax=Piscinibacter sp. TaxID=1903157 RepID=UPI002CC6E5A3|nr:fimbria/pilus periplasmic chaperone [Albitalea sp.]HUG24712.1 fimbria/pilus periplasmic chaperone [Albitalea sp.]
MLVALLFGAGCLPAWAGAFAVSPVRLYLSERDRAIAVTITNESARPVVLQADYYRWTQQPDGTDVLTDSEDLVLSPPVLHLAPFARQVVRLGRLRAPDPRRQSTYRVVIREVPEALGAASSPTLQLALAFSLPVFITPAGAQRELGCAAASGTASAHPEVECANTGGAYAQVRGFKLLRGDALLATSEEAAYVLPGARRRFVLKPAAATLEPGAAQLQVSFDDGVVQTFAVAIGG